MAKLPAGFRRLPSGKVGWRVQVNGQRRTGSADTLAEARRDRAQAQLEVGGTTSDAPTVQDLLDTWLAGVEHAPSTAKVRDAALEQLPDVFTARRASTVTPPIVAALWRELLADGVGRHTIVKIRNSLSRAFGMAVEYGWVSSNPVRAVPAPPVGDEGEVEPPAPETVRAIIDHFLARDRVAHALWVRLAATIGARPGEVCAIRWDAVDRNAGTVRIGPSVDKAGHVGPGKNGPKGHRTVDIDPGLVELFRRHERIVGCPWVFTHNGVDPWRAPGVRQELVRACDKLGIDPHVTPYDLRHFAASQALAAGEPLPKVAKMMGDNPATVARKYAHVMPGERSASLTVARSLG